jgi:hypothetical protein
MFSALLRATALLLAALSLGLSFAHLLEAPPRLLAWPPDLWRETTVFHGQYRLFGLVGGPIELFGVVLTAAVAAVAVRRKAGPGAAIAAAALYAAALAVWLLVVNPANGVMAGWRPGPLPADFAAVQRQWEAGHIGMAALKLAGFTALAWHVARRPG